MPAGSGSATLVRAPARLYRAWMTRVTGAVLLAWSLFHPTHPELFTVAVGLLGFDKVAEHAPQNDRSPDAGSSACRGC